MKVWANQLQEDYYINFQRDQKDQQLQLPLANLHSAGLHSSLA